MSNLLDEAKTIIKNNSRGDFTIPCDKLYPFQWNWDSAFTALGIYSYDKERALKELDMLFKGQWENGMIPQIIFHEKHDSYYPGPNIWKSGTDPETSCITQPPVITTVIWYMITIGFNDKEKLHFYFERLMKYHQWFSRERDPNNIGLISIFHPWESGRDNSPDWDDALNNIPYNDNMDINRKDDTHIENSLRPTNNDYNKYIQILYKCKELNWDNRRIYNEGIFNVCDPGVQFIFIKACKDLYKIAIYLEKTEHYETIEHMINLYEHGSMMLWNSNINSYTTLDMKTFKFFDGISCGSMLYAYADIGNDIQKYHMLNHSKRILNLSKFGFPSCDPSDNKFDSKRYWRGPVWCIINFLLTIGFVNVRDLELANKIKSNTIQLIEDNGFFEYYDPMNGEGYGGNNFTWTAAVYLVFKNNLLI